MDSKRTSDFINGFLPQRNDFLQGLRIKAEKDGIPIIREETEAFLISIIKLTKPRRILELGTAIGYSAIIMALALESIGNEEYGISTIEDWEPRIPIANGNIAEAGFSESISLIQGDALEIMRGMKEPYDLIFIDAAKGQYPEYLAEAMRLTKENSVIIADNVFQDGEIMESKYVVERRNRTIHKRLREFLETVTGDERLATSIIPLGDGITFSVRLR